MVTSGLKQALRRYDRLLAVGQSVQGVFYVFRKSKRFEKVLDHEDYVLLNLVPSEEYVCALTEDWTMRTQKRDWGIDFVLNHIRDLDLAHNRLLIEDLDRKNEEIDQRRRKRLRSEAEGFFSDERKSFAKTFNDINTSTLDKSDRRNRMRDRSIHK